MIELACQAYQAGQDWQVFLDRVSGKYYEKQVREAVAKYQEKEKVEPVINIPGYKEWEETQK